MAELNSKRDIRSLKEQVKKIADFTADDISDITPEEIQCLMYELQCHQIELEMQNDELVKAQFELTELNNRLHLIYHQVPVGILSLDDKGFIKATNLHFAKMMRTEINKLINHPFASFVVRDDLYRFIRGFRDFFAYPENNSIQLVLEGENTDPFPVLIKATADDGSDMSNGSVDLEKRKLVIVVTDLSEIIKNKGNEYAS